MLSHHSRNTAKDLLLLLLLTLVCYWPFSAGIFSAKNDNIIYVLPFRYQISEAIRSGHFPFWSPYIYLGFPLHGDMQSGCWNPVVWLFSLFSMYNLTLLHAEILLYLFLAGVGMYRLLHTLGSNRALSLAGGAAYLMCGYMTDVGGSNLLFLAGAAIVPFVLRAYYRFLHVPSLRRAAETAITLALLLLMGYPSLFILTGYVLLAGLITMMWLSFRRKKTSRSWLLRFAGLHLLILLFFVLLCLPALISYVQLLPYYERGQGVRLDRALQNSFHPVCTLSALFPVAAIKHPWAVTTDLISRNMYGNSFFLVFVLAAVRMRRSPLTLFLIAGTIGFFLFSLGGFTPLRSWAYHLLPLMDTFRHPSNARLFVIMGLLILGVKGAMAFVSGHISIKQPRLWILVLMAFCMVALVYAWFLPETKDGVFLPVGLPHREQLKYFLDHLGFREALWISSGVQLLLLAVLYFLLPRLRKGIFLLPVFLLNSLLLAQLSMPFTFPGKMQPAVVNRLLDRYPKGYPLPDLRASLEENSRGAMDGYDTIGPASFYNKRIGMPQQVITPTFIQHLELLLNDSNRRKAAFQSPVAYFADTLLPTDQQPAQTLPRRAVITPKTFPDMHGPSQGRLQIVGFSNNSFTFRTQSVKAEALCLQQVWLPGWAVFLDGRTVAVERANVAFMMVTVPSGTHEVVFHYRPRFLVTGLLLSLASWVVIIFLTGYKKTTRGAGLF